MGLRLLIMNAIARVSSINLNRLMARQTFSRTVG